MALCQSKWGEAVNINKKLLYTIFMSNHFLALANQSFEVNALAIWALFAFFILIYITITTILLYHWKAYGMKNPTISFARNLYMGVSLLLIIVGFISLINF